MDRLRRVLTGGTLVMVLGTVVTALGCRSTRNEVPPGKPYSTTGGTPPALGFNSDPHPNSAIGAGLYGNSATPGQPGVPGLSSTPGLPSTDPTSPSLGSSPAQLGTPAPNQGIYGQPTNNKFGPSTTPGVPGYDTGR
jgi:hypothetical protein